MPRKELLQMYHTRMSSILFKMSIAAFVLVVVLTVLLPVLSFLLWFLLFMFGLATLGIIFLVPGYWELLNMTGAILDGVGLDTLMPIVIGLSVAAVVSGVLAILLFATDKRTNNKGRIIANSVILAATVITFIIVWSIGGAV